MPAANSGALAVSLLLESFELIVNPFLTLQNYHRPLLSSLLRSSSSRYREMRSRGGETKLERKLVEKNRRIHMKNLCFKLSSLIPKDQYAITKDTLTQQDHLDQAASYIKNLSERVDKLKERKEMAMSSQGIHKDINGRVLTSLGLPVINIRCLDSKLEVVMFSGLSKRFLFHDVICILEEEGAEVVGASFSTVGADTFFSTIHSQVISSGIGLEAPRIYERLKQLIW